MSCVPSVSGLFCCVCVTVGHYLSGDRRADLIAVLRMGLLEARPHTPILRLHMLPTNTHQIPALRDRSLRRTFQREIHTLSHRESALLFLTKSFSKRK